VQVKTKNLLVIAIAALLVLALWYRVLYAPMAHSASKDRQSAKDNEASAQTLRSQLSSGSIKKNGTNGDASASALTAAIPSDPALADFLRKVDTIRASSGVTLQTIAPSPPTFAGSVESVNLAITVQGTYDQVTQYERELMALPRLVVTDQVSISTGGSTTSASGSTSGAPTGHVFAGTGSAPTVQVQMVARMFAQPTGTAIAGSGAARSTGAGGSAQSG